MKKLLLCAILTFSLLPSAGLAIFQFKEVLCSSTCGRLQNIRPPFRLKGDPSYCGDPDYELTCDGNSTILNLEFGSYYVTNLSYSPDQLQIVDFGLASDECHLPLGSISPRALKKDRKYKLTSPGLASFVNCNNVIHHDTYRPIPCLSRYDALVYIVSGYEVKELRPSCGFIAMVPTIGFVDGSRNTDVFQLLEKGFAVSWIRNSRTFGYCIRNYFRAAKYAIANPGGAYQLIPYIIFIEIRFLECVYESKDASGLPIAIAFVILLDIVFLLLLCRLILAPLCFYVFLCYEYWKMLAPMDVIETFLRNQQSLVPTRYTFREIATITSNFRDKIGQGGFGCVFKGELPRGQLVAVKTMSNSMYNGEDFINEVSTIGRIHHKNVVQLLGFCSEGSKRALVYEYMPGGSLDRYIFSSSNRTNPRPFTWEKLHEIAASVAQGIDYLHRGCDERILHFDIKPHNILLDQDFNPKVADFGLAKLYPKDRSIVSISVARGTIGYIAPELISRSFGVVSHKSDVYSYGMLLLEIAGGRRNVNPGAENSSQIYYPSWIYDHLNKREGMDGGDIISTGETDRRLLGEIGSAERKLSIIGLWCIQIQPRNRPSMSEVVGMLETDIDTLPMPPKPFFSSPETTAENSCLDTSNSEISIILE